MSLLLSFAEIRPEHRSVVGNKAFHLAQLTAEGFPVPEGTVVTAETYRRFLEECGVAGDVARLEREDEGPETLAAIERIRGAMAARPLPRDLVERVEAWLAAAGDPVLAVRSSGLEEDGDKASFAGQFETVLNVQGSGAVCEAIRTCWMSTVTQRALVYGRSLGRGIAGGMGVVLQRMLDPESSGVAFTRSPLGDADHMLIESAWGLGEAIVSGRTATDAFEIDKDTGRFVSRTLRQKVVRARLDAHSGILYEKVPEADRMRASLTTEQAEELGGILVRIRQFYGSEQDVEWALAGGRFYLLQARPISVAARGAVRDHDYGTRVLTSVDIGESWTGVMTALGQSFARHYLRNSHPALYRELGFRDTGDTDNYVVFVNGRCYLDLSYLAHLSTQSILLSDQKAFLARYSTPDMSLEGYVNPYDPPFTGMRAVKSNWTYFKTQLNHWRTYKRRAVAAVSGRSKAFGDFRNRDLTGLSYAELNEVMKQSYAYFHSSSRVMAPPYFGAFIFYDILKLLCKNWLGDENGVLAAKIKSDASDLRNMEVNEAIANLANLIREDPALESRFRSNSAVELVRLFRAGELPAAFTGPLEAFLAEHGMRGNLEIDVFRPRWVDDPEHLFGVLKVYVESGHDPVGHLTETARMRSSTTAEALARLSPLKRRILRYVSDRYITLSGYREDTRLNYLLGIWMIRKVIMEVGRRLVERGMFKELGEVAHVTYGEILTHLEKGGDASVFDRAEMERRRRELGLNLRLPAPPISFIGNWRPDLGRTSWNDVLTGLPVSPGTVTGPARVVTDLREQMSEFQHGEVLITRFTDTSWTPLFTISSAVVADIGSQLSHSAILSRELGIPCVVNTCNATEHIRTGDIVCVDGAEGRVTILSRAGEDGSRSPAGTEERLSVPAAD
jgi:prodigiosin/undecylprodigiosin synthetase